MKIDFTGKVALVTASTGGIGFAIARGLAESGAEVIVNGRSTESVNKGIQQLQQVVPGVQVRVFPAPSCRAWCKRAGDGWCLSPPSRPAISRRI